MKLTFRPQNWLKQGAVCGLFGVALGVAALTPSRVMAQNPTPLLPPESVSQTLYVSPSGNDGNNGSSGSPYATIQKAVDVAGSSTNTKIVLGNGTYRAYTYVSPGSNTLIIEAQNAGQAIISGADPIPSPTSTGTNGVVSVPWTNNWGINATLGWGTATPPSGISPPINYNLRRENVWVNNVRLTQRVDEPAGGGSVAQSALNAGEFTVDEGADKIYIKPPSGVTISGSNTEVSTRGYDQNYTPWVQTWSKPLLEIREHSNVVLRGLVVQRAATYIKFGPTVLLQGSEEVSTATELPSRVLVDNCNFSDNNGVGMEINNYREVTVQNSKFNNNGMRGAGMIQSGVERRSINGNINYSAPIAERNYLWKDCQFNDNAWRAAGSKWGDQNDTAGFKQAIQASKNTTFLRCQFNRNRANGFWADYSGENIVLDSCLLEYNKGSDSGGYGILHEVTRGPLVVQNCVIRYNNNVGFISAGSPNVTLQNNFIYYNAFDANRSNNSFTRELQINSNVERTGDADYTASLSGWKFLKNTFASRGGTNNGNGVGGWFFEANTTSDSNGARLFPSGRNTRQELAAKLLADNNVYSKDPNDGNGDAILFSLSSPVDGNRPNMNLAAWKAQSNDNGLQDQNSVFTYPIDLSGVPDPTTGATINAGVSGTSSTLTNRATGGTASASSNPVANEAADKAFDGNTNTKWLGSSSTGWLQYTFPNSKAYTITQYRIASANDAPARDPKNWTLQGSNDGSTWTNLSASQSNQTFASRNTFNGNYSVTNTTAFKSYRLNITANNGNGLIQLSELELLGSSGETGGSTFAVPIGSTVGLKSASTNLFVSTNLNSSAYLQGNYAGSVGSWEKYRVDDAGGGKIGLFSLNNSKYVSTNLNSSGIVMAGWATSIGSWEQFTWTDAGSGQIALLSANSGKYVTVPSGGTLNGNTASSIGTNEKFTVAIQ